MLLQAVFTCHSLDLRRVRSIRSGETPAGQAAHCRDQANPAVVGPLPADAAQEDS